MKRFVGLMGVLAVSVMALAYPGMAARPHGVGAAPVITSTEWLTDPVAGEEALLEIWSVDKQGVITEVIVEWGDGSISFAHSYCLQGDERGKPHRMVLGNTYFEPGEYTVTVTAVSKPSCWSPSQTARESKEVTLTVFVEP